MMAELTPDVARGIIDQLGGPGEPPEYGFQYFSVGLDHYLDTIEQEYLSSYIKDGGSSFKLVVAPYGEGKTHFLYCVRELAWRHDYVTSHIILTPEETPFHRLDRVYAAIVRNLMPPLTPQELLTGYELGLGPLLKRWVANASNELETRLATSGDAREAAESFLQTMAPSESLSFDRAMRCAFMALVVEDWPQYETALQWLLGEGYLGAAHRRLGILQRIDKTTAFPMIRSLLRWIGNMGYTGLVVLMDEAEPDPSLSSRQRELLMSNLRELIDECGRAHFKHCFMMYAVPNESFLEGRTQIYAALNQRLGTVFDQINPSGVKIDLERVWEDKAIPNLIEVGKKIAHIYSVAFGIYFDPVGLNTTVEKMANWAYDQRVVTPGYKRRFVQRLVEALGELRAGRLPSLEE